MDFTQYPEDLDFIEIPETKKRTLSELTVFPRNIEVGEDFNTILEMRIKDNTIVTDQNNIVHLELIFKLDYYPKVFIDVYTIFLIFKVDVFDRNRVIEKYPTGDLSVAYIAQHYKECGERLYQELNYQSKDKFFTSLEGRFIISEEESQEKTADVMAAYSE